MNWKVWERKLREATNHLTKLVGHYVFSDTDMICFSGNESTPKHKMHEINFSSLLVVVANKDQSKTFYSNDNELAPRIARNSALEFAGTTWCVVSVFLF